MTLSEAFQNIDIQLIPGQTYNFEVGGCQVELRVHERKKTAEEMDFGEERMLSAWTDLPVGPTSPVKGIRKVSPPRPEPFVISESDLAPS